MSTDAWSRVNSPISFGVARDLKTRVLTCKVTCSLLLRLELSPGHVTEVT